MADARVLADRYVLETRLGSGGMGTVWSATDRVLNRTVAVKLLHEGLASDATFSERFRREARSAASLGHPNIVTVYDTGEHDGIPFIVMEYVRGESLHQVLNRQGPLPVEDTARVARQVLGGLAHAHERGLIHRDMKPANVLFDAATGRAKVVDFGIAKGLDDTGGLTKTSGLIGTAAYLSPEQVDGREATAASDQYAVGCLLYACLAGEPPFTGTTPVAIAMRHLRDPVPPLLARRPDVPEPLERVIMRALSKSPNERFASAAAMEAAVTAVGIDGLPSSTPTVLAAAPTVAAVRDHPVAGTIPEPATEVASRPSRSSAWLPALTAFLVVAATAAVLVFWLQNRPTQLEEATLPTPTLAPTPTITVESPTPPASAVTTPPRTPVLDLPGIGGLTPPDDPTPSPSPSPGPTGTP